MTAAVGYLEWHRSRKCGGKVPYTAQHIARNAATALGWKGRGGLTPYPCPYCEHWHVGHDRKERTMQKPSVGRIVHYVSRGSADGEFESECRAAIVTAAPSDPDVERAIDLAVFGSQGVHFNPTCEHDEASKAGGTWHWPERVE